MTILVPTGRRLPQGKRVVTPEVEKRPVRMITARRYKLVHQTRIIHPLMISCQPTRTTGRKIHPKRVSCFMARRPNAPQTVSCHRRKIVDHALGLSDGTHPRHPSARHGIGAHEDVSAGTDKPAPSEKQLSSLASRMKRTR